MSRCACGLPILPGYGTCFTHLNQIRQRHGLVALTREELKMGKGDWKRPTDKAKFDIGYEAVFGKRELNLWNREDDDEQAKCVQDDAEDQGGGRGTTEDQRPYPPDQNGEDGRASSPESPGSCEDGGGS